MREVRYLVGKLVQFYGTCRGEDKHEGADPGDGVADGALVKDGGGDGGGCRVDGHCVCEFGAKCDGGEEGAARGEVGGAGSGFLL